MVGLSVLPRCVGKTCQEDMVMRRGALVTFVCFGVLGTALLSVGTWAGDLDTPQWAETRKALFQDRPIQEEGEAVVQLEFPPRPDDAAAVPVLIKINSSRSREQLVKNVYVVIDRNPEPLAGVFH